MPAETHDWDSFEEFTLKPEPVLCSNSMKCCMTGFWFLLVIGKQRHSWKRTANLWILHGLPSVSFGLARWNTVNMVIMVLLSLLLLHVGQWWIEWLIALLMQLRQQALEEERLKKEREDEEAKAQVSMARCVPHWIFWLRFCRHNYLLNHRVIDF